MPIQYNNACQSGHDRHLASGLAYVPMTKPRARLVAGAALAGAALVFVSSCGQVRSVAPVTRQRLGMFTGRVWVQTALAHTITPVGNLTRRSGTPVKMPGFPRGVAITPDGKTIYVICLGGVVPISTRSGRRGRLIRVRPSPAAIAITPNGKTVYVAAGKAIVPINPATGKTGKAIVVARKADGPEELAVTPDSRTVYALNESSAVPVTTATGRAGRPAYTGAIGTAMVFTPDSRTGYLLGVPNFIIPIRVKIETAGQVIKVGAVTADSTMAAMTPNGKTVYVADRGSGAVVPVNTATGKAGKPIKVGSEPTFIAITPDSKTAYVATSDGIYPIRTATNKIEKPIKIRNFVATAIAITPDGRTAWVSGIRFASDGAPSADRSYVLPVSTATGKAGQLISVGDDANCLIVRPWHHGRVLGPTSCQP